MPAFTGIPLVCERCGHRMRWLADEPRPLCPDCSSPLGLDRAACREGQLAAIADEAPKRHWWEG